MTRVLYIGTVVSNGGDEAIQRAQAEVVQAALGSTHVRLHDGSPDVARRLFPGVDVLPPTYSLVNRPEGSTLARRVLRRLHKERVMLAARVWRAAGGAVSRTLLTRAEHRQLASIAGADLVAYTGGTTLIEKYSVQGKLYEVDLALALGRPVVLLPQSLGPFRDQRNQSTVRRSLGRAAGIFLRDERSLGFLRDIGVATDRAHVVPDIVFALATDTGTERLATSEVPPRGMSVGVSVRDCAVFFEGDAATRARRDGEYRDAVGGLVTSLVRDLDARVTFISTCQGIPEYWTDDSRVAAAIAETLPPDVRDRVEVDTAYRSTDELLAALGGLDLMVCTRLHAAILALDAGTPVLPIAYEFKTHEVMGQLGLGSYVTDISEATSEALVDAMRRLLRDLPAARAQLAQKVQDLAGEARHTGELVREALPASVTLS